MPPTHKQPNTVLVAMITDLSTTTPAYRTSAGTASRLTPPRPSSGKERPKSSPSTRPQS
ncbi:MAG: hypothetical protein IPN76_32135 [Saprospiraceae bacterium]|nr:hypothetical protein [Saprospiraceae bacterium]